MVGHSDILTHYAEHVQSAASGSLREFRNTSPTR